MSAPLKRSKTNSFIFSILLSFFIAWSIPSPAAPAFGIETRTPNLNLQLTDLPATPGTMQLVRVFPQLEFNWALLLAEIPDGSGRLAVLTQDGQVYAFQNEADPDPSQIATPLININTLSRRGGEEGVLGMAFDPDYASNGYLYLYYTAIDDPRRSVISRFQAIPPDADTIDIATEEIIIEVAQPFSNHNAGMIAFGPDGYLYIALGDGGSGGDPQNHGQNTETLLGSILRIDVKSPPASGLNYAIPPDNPFVGSAGPTPDSRDEIFAYGLRNPYRFSFDMVNGLLYAADVGQGEWEEVDIIASGQNYGWNIFEGTHCYPASVSDCSLAGHIEPIAEYPHDSSEISGYSVTGGYVYYGSAVPELYGEYIFADYVSKKIFSLSYDGASASPIRLLSGQTAVTPAGFGQDSSGEVYVIDYKKPSSTGGVYVLRPAIPSGGNSFPTKLSEIPLLLEAGKGLADSDDGLIPYAPSAKLWSDGALKDRYIAMPDFNESAPNYSQIGYTEAGGWDFPNDSVLIKNFILPQDFRDPAGTAKRIETRLLIKNNNDWFGFSYEWDEAETDAQLLTTGKQRTFNLIDETGAPFSYDWLYPSRSQCFACHTASANHVLGLNTPQMNADYTYPVSGVVDNQLRTYDQINLFAGGLPDIPSALPAMPDPFNVSASLQDRARAYLAANCSMCHQPAASAPTQIDLRWETANFDMMAIEYVPSAGDAGLTDPYIIAPGFPMSSTLWERVRTLNPQHRMPPLASSRVHQEAVDLLAAWIGEVEGPTAAAHWRDMR